MNGGPDPAGLDGFVLRNHLRGIVATVSILYAEFQNRIVQACGG